MPGACTGGRQLAADLSTGIEHGRHVLTCNLCARDNLRGIEAKLDSDWW